MICPHCGRPVVEKKKYNMILGHVPILKCEYCGWWDYSY